MAWTAPKTWAVNEVLTAANMNTYVSDDLKWVATDFPRATAIGTLAVASGSTFATPTGTWSSASPNVGGMYTNSAMYLQCGMAGAYQFNLSVVFSTNATGKRGAIISSAAAGSGTIYAEDMREPVAGVEPNALTLSTGLIQCSAFQQIHFAIRQSSGSSMNCAVRFSGWWVAT